MWQILTTLSLHRVWRRGKESNLLLPTYEDGTLPLRHPAPNVLLRKYSSSLMDTLQRATELLYSASHVSWYTASLILQYSSSVSHTTATTSRLRSVRK